MTDFPRYRVGGGVYFLIVVTHQRRRIITFDVARELLRYAIQDVRERWPFRLVLLPDHFHAVVELPGGDANYSLRIQKIKERFTRSYVAVGGREGDPSASRQRKQERAVWQRRFWEHTVRDENDLKRCVDYVHWNPVKHGIVRQVADYP